MCGKHAIYDTSITRDIGYVIGLHACISVASIEHLRNIAYKKRGHIRFGPATNNSTHCVSNEPKKS